MVIILQVDLLELKFNLVVFFVCLSFVKFMKQTIIMNSLRVEHYKGKCLGKFQQYFTLVLTVKS